MNPEQQKSILTIALLAAFADGKQSDAVVAGLMAWGGGRMEAMLHRCIDRLGWTTVALVMAGAIIYRV